MLVWWWLVIAAGTPFDQGLAQKPLNIVIISTIIPQTEYMLPSLFCPKNKDWFHLEKLGNLMDHYCVWCVESYNFPIAKELFQSRLLWFRLQFAVFSTFQATTDFHLFTYGVNMKTQSLKSTTVNMMSAKITRQKHVITLTWLLKSISEFT